MVLHGLKLAQNHSLPRQKEEVWSTRKRTTCRSGMPRFAASQSLRKSHETGAGLCVMLCHATYWGLLGWFQRTNKINPADSEPIRNQAFASFQSLLYLARWMVTLRCLVARSLAKANWLRNIQSQPESETCEEPGIYQPFFEISWVRWLTNAPVAKLFLFMSMSSMCKHMCKHVFPRRSNLSTNGYGSDLSWWFAIPRFP
jgi:hypothetical protein